MFLSAYESIQACQLMEKLLGRVKQGFCTFIGLNFKWKHEHKQWRRGKQSEENSCSFLLHFWSTFRSPFFTYYIPFQSSRSQASNASNCVQFGAEMRKIWPSEANCSSICENFAPWRKSPCEIFAMWNSHCEIGHLTWCSCLPKAISSSFQLQIIHGLKRWILDFLSFQMVYSMKKMDFGKCSKSSKEDCSCFLHSVFLFSIACARVSTWNSSL